MSTNTTLLKQPMNLLEGAALLWKQRKTVMVITGSCLVVGLAVAFLTPREFTAWTTVVPQTSDAAGKLGGMTSLASLAGINLNLGGGDELSPAIYPQIMNSVLFKQELMHCLFYVEGVDKRVSLYTYYTNYADLGMAHNLGEAMGSGLDKLTGWFRPGSSTPRTDKDAPLRLTKQEDKVATYLARQVTINVDIKNGYITLYAALPQADLAAQVANKARELLQQYIADYKVEKASAKLAFIENRYQETKAEYYEAQHKLAQYRDQNRFLSYETSTMQEERLKSEYSIALSVYNELAKQLESAKIQVKEDTPAFAVIQPASVPLKPSKPKKALIVTVWLFLGVILGAGAVFGKALLSKDTPVTETA